MGWGDIVAENFVVHTIGRVTGCVDPETDQLRSDSPCDKRRDWLNRFGDAVYDELFQPRKRKE